MFRKFTVALLALIMAAGLSGLVAGGASAYPDRNWPDNPGHGWHQQSNRVDVVVWANRNDNRWGHPGQHGNRWDNNYDRWGNRSSALRVYAVDSYSGRYAASASLVSTVPNGRLIGYRYVFRNLPWNKALTVRVSGEGSYAGYDRVYLSRGGYRTVTQSLSFRQVG